MTFDETFQFVRDLEGKWVEISLKMPLPDREEPVELASFGGKVGAPTPSPPSSSSRWRLPLGDDPAVIGMTSLMLDRELFESAEAQADVPPADERASSGVTWTLLLHQAGIVVEVLVYA